ncbi:MAG: lipopolysaccharide core heptose(II) kinase RfaY [Bacteroidota bacterium]
METGNKPATKPLTKLNENSVRIKEIISILSKYSLASWLNESKIEWIKKYYRKNNSVEISTESTEIRIRKAINELGTTFIKLGQLLSTRTDLISKDLIEELSKLQSDTKTDSYDYVESVIKQEFDVNSLDPLYNVFNSVPIASASIAQVHKATLISGETVVVKIIHEGIEKKISEDMEILDALAHLTEKYSSKLRKYQPVQLIREFRKILFNEVNLKKELRNIQLFEKNFSDDETVSFPDVYPELSGKNVLTMQFVEGTNVNDIADKPDEIKNEISYRSAQVFLDMIFRDNFYHADPHPGNFFISSDNTITLIDCGMVGRLDEDNLEKIESLIISIIEKDSEEIKQNIIDIGSVPENLDTELFAAQIDDFIEEYLDLPLQELDISKAINQAIEIIQTNHITLPANITMLLRVLVMLEGSARLLNPGFNLSELLRSYYLKIALKRISPKAIFKKAKKNIQQWERAIELMPKVLTKVLNNASKSDFKVSMEHRNLEHTVNSLVTGLIVAALFLGSSLIVSAKIAPLIGEYSILGLIGMLISLIIGSILLIRIIKEEK